MLMKMIVVPQHMPDRALVTFMVKRKHPLAKRRHDSGDYEITAYGRKWLSVVASIGRGTKAVL
jgi:hypothetical protein